MSSRVVEATDATPEELAVGEVNTSIYVFRAAALWPALEQLQPKNAQGELYLTDTIEILVAAGEKVAAFAAPDPTETDGVNTRVELSAAGRALRDRINEAHMLAGVTIVDPDTSWIEPTVELEPDVTIHPFVVLRGSTRVETGRPDSSEYRRDRRARRRRGVGRSILLPSPWDGSRSRRKGGHLRGDQELDHRGSDEGSPPLVPG